jgi:hypothetical protein
VMLARADWSRCEPGAQRALYAFGGGGSGAAMRLSGCERYEGGTTRARAGHVLDKALASSASVVPHDVIAMQHGIAVVLQGFGGLLFCAGDS